MKLKKTIEEQKEKIDNLEQLLAEDAFFFVCFSEQCRDRIEKINAEFAKNGTDETLEVIVNTLQFAKPDKKEDKKEEKDEKKLNLFQFL